MAIEIASAYLSIVAETSSIPKAVDSALGQAGRSADKHGASIGSKLSSAMGATLKAGAIGAGVAAGGVLAASITKGIGRLTAIDDAQGKLKGLGHDTQATAKIMESAMASVKGTAFSLGDSATVAASAVAAGIKPGQELTKYLSSVGDAATIAGADLSEMGSIFNQVQTGQTAYTDSLNQLADRGIPIYQWLAEEMGIAAGEVKGFAEKGKVSSEQFFAAIQKNISGAALAGGKTVSGAFKNMGAAMSRFGAAVAGPVFAQAGGGFNLLTAAIDKATEKVKPFAEEFGKWLNGDGLSRLKEFGTSAKEFGTSAKDMFDKIRSSDLVTDAISRLKTVFDSLSGTAMALAPAVSAIATSLAAASAATGFSAWQVLLATLESIAPVLNATIVPALQATASLMHGNQGAVTALVLAFAAFKTIPAIMGRIAPSIASLNQQVAAGTKPLTAYQRGLVAVHGGATGAVNGVRGFGQQMQLQTQFANQAGHSIGRATAAMAVMETRSPAVSRMAASYRSATATLDGFSRRQAHAAGVARGLATASTTAAGTIGALGRAAGHAAASGVGRLGATTQGVAAGGFSALRSGASSLAGVVGGPLNAALMVGAGLLISWASNVSKAKSNVKSYQQSLLDITKAQGDMRESILQGGGKVDDSVISNLAGQVDKVKEGFDSLGKNDAKWNNVASDVIGDLVKPMNGAADDISMDMDRIAQSNKDASAAIDATGLSSTRLAQTLAGDQATYDSFRAKLVSSGEGGTMAAKAYDGVRAKLKQAEAAAKDATPGMASLSAATKILADKASSASDRTGALRQALEALGIIKTTGTQAISDYGKKIDEIVKKSGEAADATDGLGQAMLKNGQLDLMGNAGARGLNDELTSLGVSFLAAAEATGDANKAYADAGPALDQLAEKYDLLPEKIREFARQQGMAPKEVQFGVDLKGAEGVTEDLGAIKQKFDALPDGAPKVVTVDAMTEPAEARLNELGFKVKHLDSGAVEITADNGAALAGMDAVFAKAIAIGDINAVATVDLNKTFFDLKEQEANRLLEILSGQTATPGADLIIDKLKAGKDVSVKEINDLAARIADPKAILEIQEALRSAGIINAELDKAARDRFVNITVNEIRNDTNATRTEQIASGFLQRDMRGQFRATGGAIYGPGTGTSDDIPAMLSNGEHVLTASDVEKAGGQGAIYRLRQAIQGGVAKFATGGAVGDAINAARSVEGNPYVWGGTGPTGFDCSGFIGWLQQILMGLGESTKRLYTTYSLIGGSTAGLVPGLNSASPFNVGVSEEHMAATLGGQNVESGGASSPSSSGIGGSRAGASDGQFPYKFHLPVDLIAGWDGATGDSAVDMLAGEKPGFGGSRNSKWSEKDDLDLQSARVAIEQAKEARDKIRANEKKSDSDREQADLKVAKAEERVKRLEAKRDDAGTAKPLRTTPAPELGPNMTDDELELRSAEIAVTEANLQRDAVYADPDSTSMDEEKADMAVYSANNRLEETRKKLAEANDDLAKKDEGGSSSGGSFNLRDRLTQFGADVVGIAYDSVWQILGVEEPRWFGLKIPEAPGVPKGKGDGKDAKKAGNPIQDALAGVPSSFPPQDLAQQLPVTKGQPNWIDQWLKALPVNALPMKLYDQGGIIPHGGMGLNLSGQPEAVLTGPQLSTLTRIADLNIPAPGTNQRPTNVTNNYHLTDVREIERIKRDDQHRRRLSWT